MPINKAKKISKYKLLLFGVLLLAFIFRFYKLTDWFSFGMDQEYEAYIVRNIASLRHFPLIGVNASDSGLYLGPFFIYLATLPYILFQGNPIGWAITASLLGVAVTFLIFIITRKIFSLKAAYFASFIYAVSFLASFYDRHFWNPMLMGVISILTFYLMYLIEEGKYHKLPYLAAVLGLGFHSHLSVLALMPAAVYVIIKNLRKFRKKILLKTGLVFLFFLLPLFIFDIRHDFTNLQAAGRLLTGKSQNLSFSTFGTNAGTVLNFLGRFLYVPPMADLYTETGQCRELNSFRKNAYPEIMILALFGFGLFLVFNQNKLFKILRLSKYFPDHRQERGGKLLLFMLITSLLMVLVYPRNFYEYYLVFFIPLLAVSLGLLLTYLSARENLSLVVYLALFVYFILNLVSLFTAQTSYSYRNKMVILDYAQSQLKDKNYSLEALGECPRFGGWSYLFNRFVGTANSTYMDSYFNWLYYDKPVKAKADSIILLSMIDPRIKNDLISKWQEIKLRYLTEYSITAQKMFENIHVFILTPNK